LIIQVSFAVCASLRLGDVKAGVSESMFARLRHFR
jgi:hypothetical protein